LIFGDRTMLPCLQRDRYVRAGYTVIADYRLAPETKLPEILNDVLAAFAWVRGEGSRHFAIDPARLAILGHSAGGYLTLLAGGRVVPRPRALVGFYGYGDIIGRWYTTPSPYYCQFPTVCAAKAWSVVGDHPAQSGQPPSDAEVVDDRDRRLFYLYSRQQGCWPEVVAGLDPERDWEALCAYCPVGQVTADHPPTLLLHGDTDTDVPYEQSQLMARALATAGVHYELHTIAGREHGFDARAKDPLVAAAFERVLAFLAEHV
jgi:acetyl esterase/lipase